MLVYFQFKRCGYYANGLIEADNLDAAAKALWAEHVKTFKWEKNTFFSEEANTLTVEEYKYEPSSDGKTEPEKKSGGEVGL
tara:strand:- start:1024 stop:1266 length:243 start_codon:yes stop_codon:yes gene_type:complete